MIKIRLQINNNRLTFSIRKRLNTEQKNLINTNVISQSELVFSDEYIMQNIKLVHNFIKEIVNDYNIDTIIIKESSIAPLALHISSSISQIKYLYLLEESIVNYKICEKIINAKSIKYVSLYNIPTFLLEMLDNEDIKVESRNEILLQSNFSKENKLDNFSSLYYKSNITLNFPLSSDDEEDLISFININKYLKKIYIKNFNKNDIENTLKLLYKKRLKNIKIYLEQNINDPELIEYLKKINKKNSKINNIQFRIDYSQDYIEDNLIVQLHLNTIKVCVIIALILVSSVVFYIFYSNYRSMQKVEDIQKDIQSTIAEYKEKKEKETITGTGTIIDNIKVENNEEKPVEKQENDDVVSLKEINEDTVGWLKVNNTNIDYPVVQTVDNEYYLKKNFKKRNDVSGWVFMDYRSDPINLSQNTIIYGHNMYYSGVMFGTLYKVKSANWYKDPDNQIIEFDNIYNKMKWKIFSIYTVPNSNDYLKTSFDTEEKFQEFLNLITDRSIYNFNTPVSTNDKILTLSTCTSNGTKRLAVHAVLITKE